MSKPPVVVELSSDDLTPDGQIYCPHPKSGQTIWNAHPRVFLHISGPGEVPCPYCGTLYRIKSDAGEPDRLQREVFPKSMPATRAKAEASRGSGSEGAPEPEAPATGQ